MEGLVSIYIISGVTSNLASSLVPVLRASLQRVYATSSKPAASIPAGVTLISHEEALARSGDFSRALWLSPHDDVELVAKFAARLPTLVISSAAIMDHVMSGIPSEEALNAYQRSKLAMTRVTGVYCFVPGFFIDDIASYEGQSKGLHGDTSRKLYAHIKDETLDYTKRYSVTPKSFLVAAIAGGVWATHHKPNELIVVCSDREYTRQELRDMVDRQYVPTVPSDQDKYYKCTHLHGAKTRISELDVIRAVYVAYAINL
jgi:hypothetical protein